MTHAEWLESLNSSYERVPKEKRAQVVLGPILLIGTLNLLLTFIFGIPLWSLFALAAIAWAYVRIPHAAGWIRRDAALPQSASPKINLGRLDCVWNLNKEFDAQPETYRWRLITGVLVIAGIVNMVLTIQAGFPFGLLFLIALVILAFIRGTYVWGWLTPPDAQAAAPATRAPVPAPAPAPVAIAPPAPPAPPPAPPAPPATAKPLPAAPPPPPPAAKPVIEPPPPPPPPVAAKPAPVASPAPPPPPPAAAKPAPVAPPPPQVATKAAPAAPQTPAKPARGKAPPPRPQSPNRDKPGKGGDGKGD